MLKYSHVYETLYVNNKQINKKTLRRYQRLSDIMYNFKTYYRRSTSGLLI